MKHRWLVITITSLSISTATAKIHDSLELDMVVNIALYNVTHTDFQPLVDTALRLHVPLFGRNMVSQCPSHADEKNWRKFLQSTKQYIKKCKRFVDIRDMSTKLLYKDMFRMLADLSHINDDIAQCSRTIFECTIAPALKNKQCRVMGIETITSENTNIALLDMDFIQRNAEKLSRHNGTLHRMKVTLKHLTENVHDGGAPYILFVVALTLENGIDKVMHDYHQLKQYCLNLS